MTSTNTSKRLKNKLHIAIIGAGTAGLAAATLLARQHHRVTIFEKAHELKPVGAGLLLQPSGLWVFDKLGVLEVATQLGAKVTGLLGKLPSGHAIVNSHYVEANASYYGLGIHRATLCHVLCEALRPYEVELRMGTEVVDIINEPDTAILDIQASQANPLEQTAQTTQERFDMALVCNGARSHLRPKAWTLLDKPYPWGAVWAILPECDILDAQILHQFYHSTDVMMGVLPTGSMPDASKAKLSSVFWSLPSTQMKTGDTENNTNDNTERIVAASRTLWPQVSQWLADVAQGADTQWLHANYRDVVMSKYGEDRLGVLGDAAHAMSPQLGQGANMALLDAWAIAQALSEADDFTQVWQHYHRLRASSIGFYQRMSRLLTPFYQSHHKALGMLRDVGFSAMLYSLWLRKQMALTISGVKTGFLSEMNVSL